MSDPEKEEPPPASPPEYVLDPTSFVFETGNVRLLVRLNGSISEGRASSDALCLASPVWKKFLFPPWEEDGLEDEVPKIDCSDDDSEALLILLNICHLKFQMVPSSLPYETLLQVAVLCDQYDCVNIVRPWLSTSLWLANESSESLKPNQYGWLFIAWTFGRTEVFEKLATRMVLTIENSNDLDWLKFSPMPPDIMESILTHRQRLIEDLLLIPYRILDEYETKWRPDISASTRIVCRSEENIQEGCDAIIYGSLVLGLIAQNLYPRLRAEEITSSARTMRDRILKIQLQHLPGKKYSDRHESCVPDLREQSQTVLAKPFNPVLDSHRVHMNAQNA